MNWPTLAVSDYIALAGMLVTVVLFMFKFVQKVRTNDLQHLDEKIDLHHSNMMSAFNRIEEKIDDHVRDHAQGLFR